MRSALCQPSRSAFPAFCGRAMIACARRDASSLPAIASSRNWTSVRIRSRTFIRPSFSAGRASVIAASIVGDEIRGYINGVEVIAATDDRFATGSPGVGFNFFVGDTNVDHGLKSFEVDTYED